MKCKIYSIFIVLTCLAGVHQIFAQGTAFTYQGRLNSGSNPANGSYDLIFSLYDTNLPPGNLIAGPVTNSATAVSNGLFTTTVDFGPGVFNGGSNWLAIAVRTNTIGSFITLTPRQQVTPAPYAITAGNLASVVENNALPGGLFATIGGGQSNLIPGGADHATIAGGGGNSATGGGDTVSGGNNNNASNYNATISGGANNVSSGSASTVSGGSENQVTGDESVIGGGQHNLNKGDHSTIGGGYSNQILLNGYNSMVGGGISNSIGGYDSAIGGGEGNAIRFLADHSVIGGGWANTIAGSFAFGVGSVIDGGKGNTILTNSQYGVIGGGYGNTILANGQYATVPGGFANMAGGAYSFAAGQQAQAINNGAFVWADSQNTPFASTGNDQFSIRAAGGVVMSISGSAGLNPAAVTINSTSVNGIGLLVNESSSDTATLFANNGIGDIVKGFHNGNAVFEVKYDGTVISKSVALTSDRNTKEHFAALNSKNILAKVISLPLTEWNYRDDSADKKHIGPMAQDFHAAFQLDGADDKHISVVDEGGVALAAIQGLNQKVEEKDAEIQTLKRQNESLVGRMNRLESMLVQLTAQK